MLLIELIWMDSTEQREYTIETRMLQRLIKPLTVWNAVVEVCRSWIVDSTGLPIDELIWRNEIKYSTYL